MIMFTSSYPAEINYYNGVFKHFDINFKYINENPDINTSKGNFGHYTSKFYFNVLFEDKAGFDPMNDWEDVYHYLLECEQNNYLPDPKWTTKF